MNRITEVGYPDTTWQVGSGRTLRMEYLKNDTDDVTGWNLNTLHKIKITDEGAFISRTYEDPWGRIMQTEVDDDGTPWKTRLLCDILGNVIKSVRPTGWDTTFYLYDARSRLIYKKTVDAGVTEYLYDKDGNLRFVRDAVRAENHKFVYYKYDPLGRKVEEGIYSDADTATSEFTQEYADSSFFPVTNYSDEFFFTYDSTEVGYGRGRLATSSSSTGSFKRHREYDKLGRVTKEIVKVYPLEDVLEYTYDWQDNLLTQQVDNGLKVKYDYDMSGRLVGVGNNSGTTRYAEFEYWPTHALLKEELRGNRSVGYAQIVDYKYNPRNRLLRINEISSVVDTIEGNLDHFALEFGYLNSYNGNIDTLVNKTSTHLLGGASEYTEILSYDDVSRLSRWHQEGTSPSTDHVYEYDQAGNLLEHQNSIGTKVYSYYPASNKLCSLSRGSTLEEYDWDANGNLIMEKTQDTVSFQYTSRNQLSFASFPQAEWTNSLSFFYDASMRRVKKHYVWHYYGDCGPIEPPRMGPGGGGQSVCDTSDYTIYIYSYDGRLIRQYENVDLAYEFLYAGGRRFGQYTNISDTMRLQYILTDHLGSTRCVVDSTGTMMARIEYYPYGQIKDDWYSSRVPRRYIGQELDEEENLDYWHFGARYMDDWQLRFTSPDPLADVSPSWSPYVYAGANPIRFLDQNGRLRRDSQSGAFVYYDWSHTYYKGVSPRSPDKMGRAFTLHFTLVFLFANNGVPIPALLNVGTDQRFNYDCHGLTFAGGGFWINNQQAGWIPTADGLVLVVNPRPGDIIIYYDHGDVEHSVTVVSVNPITGEVHVISTAGSVGDFGDEPSPVEVVEEEDAWEDYDDTEIYRDTTENKLDDPDVPDVPEDNDDNDDDNNGGGSGTGSIENLRFDLDSTFLCYAWSCPSRRTGLPGLLHKFSPKYRTFDRGTWRTAEKRQAFSSIHILNWNDSKMRFFHA